MQSSHLQLTDGADGSRSSKRFSLSASAAQLAMVVLALAALTPDRPAAERLFQGPVSVIGFYPLDIATADLDGDGHLDLVTANYYSGPSVLFGRGDGTFVGEIRLAGSMGSVVLIQDLDHDGVSDLIFVDSSTLSVYTGNGDRTFGDATSYDGSGSDTPTVGADAADFNQDGHVDLLKGGDPITLHPGLGDGTLAPSVLLGRNGGKRWILAGRFNSDACPDFVSDDDDYRLRLWLGRCDGTFLDLGIGQGGESGFGAVSGDFNDDGQLDLVTVGLADVCVSLKQSAQQFAPAVCYDHMIDGARRITAVDLNADGNVDLVVSSPVYYFSESHVAAVGVLLSNGDGTFQPAESYGAPLLGGALTSGDFDTDRAVDIAFASYTGDTGTGLATKAFPLHGAGLAGVMFGDGHGGLSNERAERVEGGEHPSAIVAADFDGDGMQDFATANLDSDQVSIMLGSADSGFIAAEPVPVGSGPNALAAGRLDPGISTDLVVANAGSNDISVLLGQGDGTFAAGEFIALDSAAAAVVLADLDANGTLDLATAHAGAGTVGVFSGSGDGTFEFVSFLGVGAEPVAMVVTDLRGDGGADLVVVNHGSADVSVLLGDGALGFAPEVRFTVGIGGPDDVALGPEAIVAADFDRDGFQDVAVGGAAEETLLVVLQGDGQGALGPPSSQKVSRPVRSLAVRDLDGDGWEDLISGHPDPSLISVLRGSEVGFAPPLEFAGASADGLAVAEFNHDGLWDLAVADGARDNVAILLNQLEVNIEFVSGRTLTWRRLVGYDRFNTYRGNLADLQAAAPTWGSCRNGFDPDTTDNLLEDSELPAEGAGFFYLMSRVRSGVESDLGSTSSGQGRVPAVFCDQGGPK